MKRITATLLVISALSTPALAETPTQRNMHSWDYVQSVANPPAPSEAPMERHESHPYYHHEPKHMEGKHHMKKHEKHMGKKHHGKHHMKKMDKKPMKEEPKQ